MKIIVAIDSFKECLTSVEANAAACRGVLQKHPEAQVVKIPVSDGGEGWIAAFYAAIGGELIETDVLDPLMRPIRTCYLKKEELAVIEIAKASGLTLLKIEERNPMMASSYGTGMLIADAVKKGCTRFIIGLGGSATSDAGIGMLQALSDDLNKRKQPCSLLSEQVDIHDILAEKLKDDLEKLKTLHFSIASDVANPLCGPMGAAHVFGPQKGATPSMVEKLDQLAFDFAQQSAHSCGYDCSNKRGAGAAGGLGYAFMQYMQAECRSGIDLLLDAIHFDELLMDANLVITGEGSADRQTLMGKLPFGILQCAQKHRVPVMLIAGRIADEQQLLDAGFSHVTSINPSGLPLDIAMQPATAKTNICRTLMNVLEG